MAGARRPVHLPSCPFHRTPRPPMVFPELSLLHVGPWRELRVCEMFPHDRTIFIPASGHTLI